MPDEQKTSGNSGSPDRDRYRDNDDVRDPLPADQRSEPHPDSKSEARGDARENVGNTARGTAADPRPGGNDHTKHRHDEPFDDRIG